METRKRSPEGEQICLERFALNLLTEATHRQPSLLDKLNEAATYADSRGGVRSKKKKARRSAQMASSPTLEMGLESDESPGTTPLSPGDPPYKAPSAAAAAAAAAPGPSSTSERLAADLTSASRATSERFAGRFCKILPPPRIP
ncbi:MAG: hypothetical protein BJ554DRAFT_880 [Olpidium bornovanus]|uniref:Uncharacterized protein n=1 Tax=Olpidium bornovanus TaxID=278681 RepID=A0A8H7ZSZ6_9FUNG|nr:MAG: hypothetical protein BJ554DRAFT_880 [Olpidium bornovanus]